MLVYRVLAWQGWRPLQQGDSCAVHQAGRSLKGGAKQRHESTWKLRVEWLHYGEMDTEKGSRTTGEEVKIAISDKPSFILGIFLPDRKLLDFC